MSDYKEKDLFSEYDKFWDQIDEIEEIKEDQDFFKDRYQNKKQNEMNFDFLKKHAWWIGMLVFFLVLSNTAAFIFPIVILSILFQAWKKNSK